MWWGNYGFSWGGVVLMILSTLFWLALLGVLIWALARWIGGRTPTGRWSAAGPSAMEILRQRYARGEIDGATFDRMREALEASQRNEKPPQSASS